MAPQPNESSLYECPPAEGRLAPWKDDSPPAVHETVALNTSSSSSAHLRDLPPSPTCSCRRCGVKLAALFKASWRNRRYFRWIMTIAITFAYVITLGFFNSFGTLYMCLRRDLHSTAVETGWVASLCWSFGIFSPCVNALYQRFGPRKIVITGTFLCFCGLLASSFVNTVWLLFLTFGIICGLGIAFIVSGTMNLISSYFESNDCALPTTLPGAGGAIGMLIYSPLLEIAYERFGWRTAIRFVAALILIVGLALAVWYKRPSSLKEKGTVSTENVDSTSIPSTSSCTDTSITLSDSCTKEERRMKSLEAKLLKQEARRDGRRKSKENYVQLIKDPAYWMFCIATMLSNVVMIFNIINLPD